MICDRSVVSKGNPVSSTDKNDHHDITEIVLEVTFTPYTNPSGMLDVSGDCLSCMPFGFPVPKYLLLDFPIF